MSMETFYSQKCVLCYSCERDCIQHWPEIKYSDVLPCLKYIPPDINQTVEWNQLDRNNHLFLCDICKENFGSLSKLSFDLEEIQTKINNLVEVLVSHIRKERGDYNRRQSKPIKSSLDFSSNVDNYQDFIDSDCNDEANSKEEETAPNKPKDSETSPTSSESKFTETKVVTPARKSQRKATEDEVSSKYVDDEDAMEDLKVKVEVKMEDEFSEIEDSDDCENFNASDCNKTYSNDKETPPIKTQELETVECERASSSLKSTITSSKIQYKEQRKPKSNLHKILDSTSVYGCSTCGKKFSQYTILKKHECWKPTVECEICGLSFSNLRTHMQSKHLKGKTFECDVCGKKFAHAGMAFRRHKMSHDETRSYKCDVCDKSFIMLKNLKVHLVLHSTESSRPC